LCRAWEETLIGLMRFSSASRALGWAVLGAAWLLSSCTGNPPPLTPWPVAEADVKTPLPPEVQEEMLHVEGTAILTHTGEPIALRGIAFSNEASEHTEIPSGHHGREDYARLRKMGMNSVRFHLSYKTFEDDEAPFVYKESGFEWLDQNVEWARENKIRLILTMHAPAGASGANGGGGALWDDADLQTRFAKLWRAIAKRYRAEPTIVGFSLLNEAHPQESREQWKQLAERTIDEIRRVDQHHILFVERVSTVGGDFSEDEDRNFLRVKDPNVVYEFHFEKPFHFTHQNEKERDFAAREGWYPDENITEVEGYNLKREASVSSSHLPPGDSSWTLLETEPFVVADEKLAVGKPFLFCDEGHGSAVFDSLSLTRVRVPPAHAPPVVAPPAPKWGKPKTPVPAEPPLEELETVFEVDLDTRRGWEFWNPSGEGASVFLPTGHGDNTAVSIRGTEGPAHLSSDPLRFRPEPGYEYQLRGLARGVGLAEKARCGLRLEFYSSKVPVHKRGKAYLEQELESYLEWGKKAGVPLYLGEFGTIADSFLPERGGEKWVRDMLDLLTERKISFAYYAYHEAGFGLFSGGQGLPSVQFANQVLYETLVKALVGPDADTRLVESGAARESAGPASETKPNAKQPTRTSGEEPVEQDQTNSENFHDFD
jgi:endoglucanase